MGVKFAGRGLIRTRCATTTGVTGYMDAAKPSLVVKATAWDCQLSLVDGLVVMRGRLLIVSGARLQAVELFVGTLEEVLVPCNRLLDTQAQWLFKSDFLRWRASFVGVHMAVGLKEHGDKMIYVSAVVW